MPEEAALRAILEMLRTTTGHDFSGCKRGTILRRLARRMQLTGQPTWAALQAHVIAPLVPSSAPHEQLRAWVPGCATTELVNALREELLQATGVEKMEKDHYPTSEDLRAANEELQSLNEE